MNGPQEILADDAPSGEDLMAYLDGEMDAESRRRLEDRLSYDADLRLRLKEYQQTWDLLDEIPRATVDDSFTRTTVEMVAIRAEAAVAGHTRQGIWRRNILLAGGLAGIALSAGFGYWLTHRQLSGPNRQLLEILPVIENLDAYQNTSSLEFLRELDRQQLFREDDANEP